MPRERVKNVQADVPDSRDWIYEPPLIELPSSQDPPQNLHILDQGFEGACTGFALAGAINLLNRRRRRDVRVSPRMLYEMARKHDEWPGESYDGSSIRGAVAGWKNMGVCSEKKWPYRADSPGYLTIRRAKDARENTIGAYYRIRPVISDVHAALSEAGVIVASAQVHKGWDAPSNGRIRFHKKQDGGHAFAVVGFDDSGLFVQNSWGPNWGKGGVALWTYEDWVRNVMDMWVFRLALPTPQIFGRRPESSLLLDESEKAGKKPTIDRGRIASHFVHVDDGRFKGNGRYWSTREDVEQTAKMVAAADDFDHLLVYVHGGLNSPKASARRVAAMKEGYKRNGVYPFHIMYDTGLAEELKDLIFRKGKATRERVGAVSKITDRFLEGLLRLPGTLVWDEMKRDARDAFAPKGAGTVSLGLFARNLSGVAAKNRKKIHLAGHSTGAIVIAHLLQAMANRPVTIESCSLMAPACTVELYHQAYLPVLARETRLRLKYLQVFNLREKLEKDDNVAKAYRKSLLYLVSNAFEGKRGRPLLGMEKYQDQVRKRRRLPEFHLSNGVSGTRTRSTSHGGFDNDVYTMNHVLRTILGRTASQPFTEEELKY